MLSLAIAASFFIINTGCQKTAENIAPGTQNVSDAKTAGLNLGNFMQVNLVANTRGYSSLYINKNLINAWGLSASPGGTFWISANDGGKSFVYNAVGAKVIPPVDIPSHMKGVAGNATGQIFNGTTDFVIPGTGRAAAFLFAGEDGTISGWNGGPSAIVVADHSKGGSSYKGIAMANDGGSNFLYAANFTKHRVDVLDNAYNFVTGRPFHDPGIPAAYGPFNIRNINNMLYVTYAVVKSNGDDSTGAGLGYVDVYWPNGTLSKRIATQGTLNAPWGITPAAPQLLGTGGDSTLLIGNFGDGHINVFDWDGNFLGQLLSQGVPVAIEGLWAIDNTVANTSRKQLYFTAGPNDESDGVFGFLSKH
jgi:uncharacterized protein (TIGR03118 family)